jgi:hypothetical protein
MSESIIILSTGERVRVASEYEQLKKWHLGGGVLDLQTRGTYPDDPPMLIASRFIVAIMPATETKVLPSRVAA